MKHHAAKFSDLAGPLNPAGIMSAKYLMLISALNRGDHPDNIKQALFDWLGEKRFSQNQILSLINSQEPEQAVNTIIQKLGAGLRRESLPQQFIDTVRRALASAAKDERQRRGHEIGQEIARMRQTKKRYTPETLAAFLLKA